MRLAGCMWLALLLSTGSLGLYSRSSIVGGKDARSGKWPWMVYVAMTNGKNNLSCGGSLINRQWVLTAAHCVNNRHVKSVVIGRLSLRENHTGWEYSVSRVITHPGYKLLKYKNDLALIQLDKPVELHNSTVWPVRLPTPMDVFNTSSKCWVTGWGKVSDNAKLEGKKTLQQLRVPLLDKKTCKSKWREQFSNKKLCAGFLEGGKGACQGDSGGPLVCKSRNKFVQVGVVSFASQVSCVLAGHPAVFTRVGAYTGFINRVIHQYS